MYLVDRIKKSTAILLAGGLLSTGCATKYGSFNNVPDPLPKLSISKNSSNNFDHILTSNKEGEIVLDYMLRLNNIRDNIINLSLYNPHDDLSRLERDIINSSISSKSELLNSIRNYGYNRDYVENNYLINSKSRNILNTIIWTTVAYNIKLSMDMDDSGHSTRSTRHFHLSIISGCVASVIVYKLETSPISSRVRRTRRYVPLSR
jgi:hypothetical protein